MNILKQIRSYLVWLIVSLLLGISHMLIILGPRPKPFKRFWRIFDWIYEIALFGVGAIIGFIIAFFFIILDVFYLKKKLANNRLKNVIRFVIIIVIAIVVGLIHYVCEKVIDII